MKKQPAERKGESPREALGDGIRTVLPLDPSRREFPEGVATDGRGCVYVGLRFTGAVLRFREGEKATALTIFEGTDAAGEPLEDQGLLGLATDDRGDVYAAVASFAGHGTPAQTHGVWRVSPPGGRRQLIPGTDRIFFPNALAFADDGTLYVTSSCGPPSEGGSYEEGAIWRLAPGAFARPWLRHPALTGTGGVAPEPFPIGANGIAYHAGALFVANTERRQVVEVPIGHDGSPGPVRVVVRFPGPTEENPHAGVLDGLAVDVDGNLYPLLVGEGRLVRVPVDGGEIRTLAGPEDGLQAPTSLAFGPANGRTSLYVADFAALATRLGQEPHPKVVRIDVARGGAGSAGG